ncbi:MAG: hypothetical protein KUG77_21405 [Nannocystaceae bacterium]|nr:hypothetical protein [Nannocystaceae bacterium]
MAAQRDELRLGCACGRVVLHIEGASPAVANRVACHCRGCNRFANDMRPEILDALGGTERFQVSPATVTIVSGQQAIACRQQTRKGALRWYASCCNTPLGLTLPNPKVPFVGLDVHALDHDEKQLEAVLGPLRARVNVSPRPENAKALKASHGALFSMLRHLIPLTWRWWRQGEHRSSPFFDAQGRPIVEVERRYEKLPALATTAGCR